MNSKLWAHVETSKLYNTVQSADAKFNNVRGAVFWNWVAERMPGRTASACRSKHLHTDYVAEGINPSARAQELPKPNQELIGILVNINNVLVAIADELHAANVAKGYYGLPLDTPVHPITKANGG